MIAAAVMAPIWFEACRPRVGGTGSADAREIFFRGDLPVFPSSSATTSKGWCEQPDGRCG